MKQKVKILSTKNGVKLSLGHSVKHTLSKNEALEMVSDLLAAAYVPDGMNLYKQKPLTEEPALFATVKVSKWEKEAIIGFGMVINKDVLTEIPSDDESMFFGSKEKYLRLIRAMITEIRDSEQ